jgi:hypothetical protein
MGHFSRKFKAIHRHYLEQLELYDLIDILDAGASLETFIRVKEWYRLGSPINCDENGILHTDINLAEMQGFFDFELKLPAERFKRYFKFNDVSTIEFDTGKQYHKPDYFFSFALTKKNKGKYTAKGERIAWKKK